MVAKQTQCTVDIIACFFFFFFLFLVLEVCILTILINQLELIETRIAHSLYGSHPGRSVVAAQRQGRCVLRWEVAEEDPALGGLG